MIVRFAGPRGVEWSAARQVTTTSTDGCFSLAELAIELGGDLSSALAIAHDLERRHRGGRMADDCRAPPTVDERWYLVEHDSLTVGREYDVLTIEDDLYRILNDRDDPVLDHVSLFDVLNDEAPPFWTTRTDSDGDRHRGPPRWLERGFFEGYHDRLPHIREEFWEIVRTLYPRTWRRRGLPG
jgi:hypothetical protein